MLEQHKVEKPEETNWRTEQRREAAESPGAGMVWVRSLPATGALYTKH